MESAVVTVEDAAAHLMLARLAALTARLESFAGEITNLFNVYICSINIV